MIASEADITDERIRELAVRYDTRGPRYTSYPTAPQWTAAVDNGVYRDVLQRHDGSRPVSVYVHIPFCARLCLYCACNVRLTGKQAFVERYLAALRKETETVAGLFSRRPHVAQLHLGGGTPTFLSTEQLARAIDHLDTCFSSTPDAERSIEVDPRITSREHLQMLHSRGFRRISIGVQDLDPRVQEAVGRRYGEDDLAEFVAAARRTGFREVNLDLMYGLPCQTEQTWRRTVEAIVAIRPDRLAVFGYAHVPWMKPHQKSLERFGLPGAEERLSLAITCRRLLVDAGYHAVGLDHFALPDDSLARAFREGRVHRNFMGYTVQGAETMVAVGASSIGDFPAAYVHNDVSADGYIERVESDGLAVVKGHVMSFDDRLRRRIIVRLMGNFHVLPAQIEREFGIVFADHFASEITQLDRFTDEGILRKDADGWHATLEGTFVIRNVAMVFDRWLRPDRADTARYSRTI